MYPWNNRRAYDPEQLQALEAAFEEAWTLIVERSSAQALDNEADTVRSRLASCLLELYDEGVHDPGLLRDSALDRLGLATTHA